MNDNRLDEEVTGDIADPPLERVGEMIGRYKLLGPIGEGGFGVVWAAEQREPVTRRVALKIIKPGMDSRQVLARFKAEQQALAMMNHPGVAKVLDAGTTDGGRPYFAMEHVPGIPITEHCDRHKLTIDERLELLILTCDAVQHAHQKGLIHRDIKPSNILVTNTDSGAQPKVIDFGIAKVLGDGIAGATIYTRPGQMIGTPAYMAPEQIEQTSQGVDTRADIYSLGVLLYELLTGKHPLEVKGRSLLEIQRRVVDQEPVRPSTRLSSLGIGTAEIARRFRTDARSLLRSMRGDVDWIVMKCLEKDPARRYDTTSALAEDLRRHLNDEPVLAGPPRTGYRLKKFVKRNRLGVGAACLVALILIGGIVGTGWGLRSALNARDAEADARESALDNLALANAREQTAIDALEAAANAQREAEARAVELEQVTEFQARQLGAVSVERMGTRMRESMMREIEASFDASPETPDAVEAQRRVATELLDQVNFSNLARQSIEEDILASALDSARRQFADQPLIRARLLEKIALTTSNLGLFGSAISPQREALEIYRAEMTQDHLRTINAMFSLGRYLRHHGDYAESEALHAAVLDARRRLLGDDDPATLDVVSHMGGLLRNQGRMAEAEPFYREALEGRRRLLGSDSGSTVATIMGLGLLLKDQGRLTESEPYMVEALETSLRVSGLENARTATCMLNLAAVYRKQNRLEKAEPLILEGLRIRRAKLGDGNSRTIVARTTYCDLLRRQGHVDEAESCFRAILEVAHREVGAKHLQTMVAQEGLGGLLIETNRPGEAEPLLREALASREDRFGASHFFTATTRGRLGESLIGLGRFAEAEPLLQRSFADLDTGLVPTQRPYFLPAAAQRLVTLYEAWGRTEDAERWATTLASLVPE